MKTLYCFGDSNTWGYDPRSFMGMQYPENIRWTGIIKAKTGCNVINDGMNGRCIPESRRQTESIAECVMKYADDTVLLWIMLGNLMQDVARKHEIDFTDAGKFDIPVLSDGIHFSEEGHRIFADEMLNVFNLNES